MRNRTGIILAVFLTVGCGEVSPAGGTGVGGSGGTEADAAGTAGTTGAGGTGGSEPLPSCDIPIGQVSGVDMESSWSKSNGCQGEQGIRVQVVDGAVFNFPHAAEWAPKSYTAVPITPGQCDVSLRYERQDAVCGAEKLFVHLTVPAI